MTRDVFCPDGGYGTEQCKECGTKYPRAGTKYCPTCFLPNPNYEASLWERFSASFSIPGVVTEKPSSYQEYND